MIRRALSRAFWAVSRWSYRADPLPAEGAGLLIGAPHTSNWDFVMMLAITWRAGVSAKFLGKDALFRGPFGPLMRALGGIPVDRSHPHGLVDELVDRIAAGERFFLVVTPEGTRSKRPYWKSGFYYIALEAGLPVTLGFVDRSTMTVGLGETIRLTGDMSADMSRIRAFYAGKTGVRPAYGGVPRLRGEDGETDAGSDGAGRRR